MKIIKKFSAVLVYLLLIAVLLNFDLQKLFDVRQAALVLLGAALLYLPGSGLCGHTEPDNVACPGRRFRINWELFGRSALFASVIETFVLLFILLSNTTDIEGLFYDIALECRPLLYGFCIFLCLGVGDKNNKTMQDSEENRDRENMRKELTVEEYMKLLREKGLSAREAEVAVQVNRGLTNAQIADELCITETTVKKHLSNIFAKLKITRREQIRKSIDER